MNVKYTISSSFQGLETPISTTPVAPTVPGALPGLNVIRRVKAPTLQAAIATACTRWLVWHPTLTAQ